MIQLILFLFVCHRDLYSTTIIYKVYPKAYKFSGIALVFKFLFISNNLKSYIKTSTGY